MTDRRRTRRRRRRHDHLMAGAGIAVLVGAALIIGFDASRRSDFMSSAVVSIDPLAGAGSAVHEGTTGSPRRIARAGLLPGEIVIETAGVMPPGQWRLGERRIAPPPVVLDSVAAGRNALTFTAGDSIRWQAPIDLAPGGIAHVMVPAFDSAAAAPEPPPAPADSTDAP